MGCKKMHPILLIIGHLPARRVTTAQLIGGGTAGARSAGGYSRTGSHGSFNMQEVVVGQFCDGFFVKGKLPFGC